MSLTEEQHARRREGIGASEIGTIAGLNPYGSLLEVYASKIGAAPRPATLPMDLGNLLEEPIAAVYSAQFKRALRRVDTIKSPTHALALATPDRAAFLSEPAGLPELLELEHLAGAERLVQIKSVDEWAPGWGTPGTDEIPETYLAQVQWEMGVSGVRVCDVVALFGRRSLERYTVHFSATLFAALYELAERFWREHVHPKRPPDADTSKRYAEALERMFPVQRSEALIVATPELDAELASYRLMHEVAKRAKAWKGLHENRIKAAIGDATGIASERWGKVTWKRTRDGKKVDWEACANDAMTLAALVVHRLEALEPETTGELRERLRGMVAEHTTPKPGHRRLHKAWAKAAPPLPASFLLPLDDDQPLDAGEDEE